jgi:DNA polymerase-3 subunit epsilon
MIIVDQGRAVDERSAVWVDQGLIKGFTYFNLNFQIKNIDVLANLITPLEHNKDAQHIIQSYVRRNKRIKVISIED